MSCSLPEDFIRIYFINSGGGGGCVCYAVYSKLINRLFLQQKKKDYLLFSTL